MPKGISEVAAGMLAGMNRFQTIANNLANLGTTGYKRDQQFLTLLSEEKARLDAEQSVGTINRTLREEKFIDFTQGDLSETGNELDIAINGDGFFTVQTQDREAFTRNGAFTMNEEKVLVDYSGNPVMGEGGEILLTGGEISIDLKGNVSVDGVRVDSIKVVTFEDLTDLRKIGKSMFIPRDEEIEPVEVTTNYTILQGYVETSNVNLLEEMVSMITLGKEFEVNQRLIKAHDEMMAREARELGRIR